MKSTLRPPLLMHCQHSLGLGHLVRSLALAEALVERFDVTLLSGGVIPTGMRAPRGVRLVSLPPLGMEDRRLVSRDAARTVEEALAERLELVLGTLRATRPVVVVVELFPFGRKQFSEEIVPLLEHARAAGAATACSVRDILVGRGERQASFDERASLIANRLLDVILVHSDERLARLEESFAPQTPLRVAVHHTGFVVPAGAPAPRPSRDEVVVSAGGGLVGGPLHEAALDAHARVRAEEGLDMTLIAGPLLPDDEWAALRRRARGRAGLVVLRSVDNLRDALAGAAVSVSQCGYNTALDVLRARVPALMVPFSAPGEDEQTRRAMRLAALGAVSVLDPARLDGDTLARAIAATRRRPPAAADLRLDGARASARLLAGLAGARTEAAA
jgi:predicted glycosyltransferase